MIGTKTILCGFIALLLSFACDKQNLERVEPVFENNSNLYSQQSNVISLEEKLSESEAKVLKTKKTWIACWSGADVTVYYFNNKDKIEQNIRRSQTFNYEDIKRNTQQKAYLLKIQQRDSRNELQGYLDIKIVNNNEIEINDYLTPDTFINGKSVGRFLTIKDNCADIKSSLKK